MQFAVVVMTGEPWEKGAAWDQAPASVVAAAKLWGHSSVCSHSCSVWGERGKKLGNFELVCEEINEA